MGKNDKGSGGIHVWGKDQNTEEVVKNVINLHSDGKREHREAAPRGKYDLVKPGEMYAVRIRSNGTVQMIRVANKMSWELNSSIGHSAASIRKRWAEPPILVNLRAALHRSSKLSFGVFCVGVLSMLMLGLFISPSTGVLMLVGWIIGFFAFYGAESGRMGPVLEDIHRAVGVIEDQFAERYNLEFRLLGAFSKEQDEFREIATRLRQEAGLNAEHELEAKTVRVLNYKLEHPKESE